MSKNTIIVWGQKAPLKLDFDTFHYEDFTSHFLN
jgi:hypothetical protein